ncbi:DNA-binding protein [Streptomyces carminius]|uniref:DNA-binding protein n=1 Tax=Streptomyces carminius TaxID=2665496 RepID=A0A2M8MBL8_9ACTN|nr:DNA-binding protein [Streptomyces carminius]PJF01583.1 DNA-binding protein [Streptomyces carminius]
MTRTSATPGGTLVLDGEGLAKAVLRDRDVTRWPALAAADDMRVITSAATLVEVVHPRIRRPALEWTLSRMVVELVTILTSDPDDLMTLCGSRAAVAKV